MEHFSRRQFLRMGALGAAGAAATLGGWQVLRGAAGDALGDPADLLGAFPGYGPPVADPEGVLALPEGFRYTILAAEGDRMDDGTPRPPLPDGMEVYDAGGGRLALCLNHEIRFENPEAFPRPDDRTTSPAGCTTIVLRPDLSREAMFVSQSDTAVNCAGGRSPWGTWLTCEEFESPGTADGASRGYGWVYDVDPFTGENGSHYPAMGRFFHEAIAFDPATGTVYETEDQPDGLFYRFTPERRDDLRSGRLEAMQVLPPRGRGDRLRVRWIDVSDVATSSNIRFVGRSRGATPFDGCEGITHFGGSIYFDEGEGGDAGLGRIWRYRPAPGTLELFYESADRSDLQQPDNLREQPGTGDLVYCEDRSGGDEPNKLVIQAVTGEVVTFAVDMTGSELAGASWDPSGRRLFVNIHDAGLTVAVEGPFREGLAAQRLGAHVPPRGGVRRADPDLLARAARDRGMGELEVEAALGLGLDLA